MPERSRHKRPGQPANISIDKQVEEAIEAINGIIQLAKRRARGFRNFLYLRTIAYWNTGKLPIDTSPLLPT
jgi:hypothetical protein